MDSEATNSVSDDSLSSLESRSDDVYHRKRRNVGTHLPLLDKRMMRQGRDPLVDLEISTFEGEGLSVEEGLSVLLAARRLNGRPMLDRVIAMLNNSLSVLNCVQIYHVASSCGLDDLRVASHRMICKNFKKVSETREDFTNLSLNELSLLVFSDHVHATEEQVFNAIVRWVKADLKSRRYFVSRLLPAVRHSRCSLMFLTGLVNHSLVQDDPSFQAAVLERMQWLEFEGITQDRFATKDSARAGGRNILFVMGGHNRVAEVETMDPSRGSWVCHNIPDAPGLLTWICSMGHKILVMEVDNMRFRSFDVLTMQWTCLRSLPHQRLGSCRSYYNHHVYVLGGEHPYETRCDRYDALTDEWVEMTPLLDRREDAAAVCLNGKLYCSGGIGEIEDECLPSLEVLNLRGIAQWDFLPPMKVGRTDHSLASYGSYLWAIGGNNNGICVSAVERYDVQRRQWCFVQELDKPLNFLTATALDGYIYVIGGENEEFETDPTVNIYDVETDEWLSGMSLHVERSSHGTCVVKSLSDTDADLYTG